MVKPFQIVRQHCLGTNGLTLANRMLHRNIDILTTLPHRTQAIDL
jgi:hypothetical protein